LKKKKIETRFASRKEEKSSTNHKCQSCRYIIDNNVISCIVKVIDGELYSIYNPFRPFQSSSISIHILLQGICSGILFVCLFLFGLYQSVGEIPLYLYRDPLAVEIYSWMFSKALLWVLTAEQPMLPLIGWRHIPEIFCLPALLWFSSPYTSLHVGPGPIWCIRIWFSLSQAPRCRLASIAHISKETLFNKHLQRRPGIGNRIFVIIFS